jgi:hypothetical protein
MRPVFGSCDSDALLVDKIIGNSYAVVKFVAQNIEYIKHTSANMAAIYRLHASAAEIDALAAEIEKFDAVYLKLTELLAVHAKLTEISGVYNSLAELQAIFDNLDQLLAVYAIIPDIEEFLTGLDTKLNLTGGTLTGPLTLSADPINALHAATKQYVDQIIAAQDAMVFKGVIDCSANPNYPAADRGWTYRVSVAGKIGGASGVNVEQGDLLLCLTDGTVAGNQAAVGASWSILQTNIDGAVIGPATAVDATPAVFDGTAGKLLKNITFATFKTALALVKADVGLGNVDNTADANKPVSTLQQAAIDTKFASLGLGTPSGRLTLTSGSPVMTANVSAAGTVYYTPHLGSSIPIRNKNSGLWLNYSFAELSNVLANTVTGSAGPTAVAASQVYDLYVWDTDGAGTLALTRSPAWSDGTAGSNTVRGTGAGGSALQRNSGILNNVVAIVNGPAAGYGTYVGTIATDSSGATVTWHTGGAASGGTAAYFNVWNMYNRIKALATVTDNGAAYTYSSATIRQARGSVGNQVNFVRGIQEDAVLASMSRAVNTVAAAAAFTKIGFGIDTAAAFTVQPGLVYAPSANAMNGVITPALTFNPGIGVRFIAVNEAGDGTNSNSLNPNSLDILKVALRA